LDGEENIDNNILNAYRNALRKAWEDGRVSIEERTILQQFKGDLPIPEETLSLIEAREYFRYRWSDYETSPLDLQLKVLDEALEVDPDNDFLWAEKGAVLYKSGDPERALEVAGSLFRGELLPIRPTSRASLLLN